MVLSSRAAAVRDREVVLQNPNRYPGVDLRRQKAWLGRLLAEIAPRAGSFAARLMGERAMRRLNRDFRGVDRSTDVLSFAGEKGTDGGHLGDVAICYPVALRQAERAGRTPEEELRRLLLHGILHCLGYDHETDRGEMRRLERRLARRWVDDDAR